MKHQTRDEHTHRERAYTIARDRVARGLALHPAERALLNGTRPSARASMAPPPQPRAPKRAPSLRTLQQRIKILDLQAAR